MIISLIEFSHTLGTLLPLRRPYVCDSFRMHRPVIAPFRLEHDYNPTAGWRIRSQRILIPLARHRWMSISIGCGIVVARCAYFFCLYRTDGQSGKHALLVVEALLTAPFLHFNGDNPCDIIALVKHIVHPVYGNRIITLD
jgi:hypothetical protein